MWLLVAAETSTPGVSDQLIIMVGGIITAAIVALGGVMVAVVNSRNRTTPSPPPPPTSIDEHVLYERTAVHNKRLDDADERFDVLDKAQARARGDLDDVLDWLDERHPDWRP